MHGLSYHLWFVWNSDYWGWGGSTNTAVAYMGWQAFWQGVHPFFPTSNSVVIHYNVWLTRDTRIYQGYRVVPRFRGKLYP